MTRPRGTPPTPSARSSEIDPVEIDWMSCTSGSSAPRRISAPLPNCFSMFATASSSAFSFSTFATVSSSGMPVRLYRTGSASARRLWPTCVCRVQVILSVFSQGSDMLSSRLGLAALCSALSLASAARADWEGDMVAKRGERQGQQMPAGKMRAKDGKLRIEMKMGPMSMTTLVDFAGRKVFMINEAAKEFSEIDADRGTNIPKCTTVDFIACMKEQGYKKAGTET